MKILYACLFVTTTFLVACGSDGDNKKTDTDTSVNDVTTTNDEQPSRPASTDSSGKFDTTSVPVSRVPLGEWPYVAIPEGFAYQNTKPLERDYDEVWLPLTGKFEIIGGKTLKAHMNTPRNSNKEFSQAEFLRAYDRNITALGGAKVFSGEVSKEEANRYYDNAKDAGEEGSVNFKGEPVTVYYIRHESGKQIYILLYAYSAAGAIQIVEKDLK